jgi:cbb3-type cytochrome oxidase subunit 3
MRSLIPHFDPSWWMTVSALVFLLAFTALVVWVYLPSRRRYYDVNARIPLQEEKPND